MNFSFRRHLPLYLPYFRPQRTRIILLGVLLLLGISMQLLNPQIIQRFIDAARRHDSMHLLIMLSVIYLIAGFIDQVSSACVTYLSANVGWMATNQLRADLAQHCLRLDIPFHQERTPGEMIERIDADIMSLANFFSQFLVRVLSSTVLLAGVLVLLYRIDWRVGVALTLFAGVATLILWRLRALAVPAQKAEREASASQMGFIEERLGGIEDIRANGAGAYTMRRFAEVTRTLFHAGRKAMMIRGTIWFTTIGLFILGTVLALVLGIYLFRLGIISLGTVYLIYQYNNMLRNPLEQLTRQMQELQQAGAAMLRVHELLNIHPEVQDGVGSDAGDGPLEVTFAGVTFAYGDGPTVLHDVNFTLAPGRVLGVLGRTGSGKTTMTRLLFRLYDLNTGGIRLNGIDLREMRLAELRRHVGMVTQDVQLFHASVRDNLTFFDRTITDKRILQVISDLGLREWLEALPAGLDTMLQAGGSGLSAGESQLLAFTRVFLEDPGLVLLDEPSSRLDPATERLIERAVDTLLRNRTCIIIAHRLGTVQRADEILVLDDGHILELGPREALAADPASRFAHLLRTGMERELA